MNPLVYQILFSLSILFFFVSHSIATTTSVISNQYITTDFMKLNNVRTKQMPHLSIAKCAFAWVGTGCFLAACIAFIISSKKS